MADRNESPKVEKKPLSSAQTDPAKPAFEVEAPTDPLYGPLSKGDDGQLRPERPFENDEDAVEALQENVERRNANVGQGADPLGAIDVSEDEIVELEQRLSLDPTSINDSGGFSAGRTLEAAHRLIEAEIAEQHAAGVAASPYIPAPGSPRSNVIRNIVAARERGEVDYYLAKAAELRGMVGPAVQAETTLDPNTKKRLQGKHPEEK